MIADDCNAQSSVTVLFKSFKLYDLSMLFSAQVRKPYSICHELFLTSHSAH